MTLHQRIRIFADEARGLMEDLGEDPGSFRLSIFERMLELAQQFDAELRRDCPHSAAALEKALGALEEPA